MISEATAQRIAAALERLAAVLERNQPAVPATLTIPPTAPLLPSTYEHQCIWCGGYHHGGLMCPQIAPTVSVTRPA